MRPGFLINNRNKGKFVYRCVAGGLAQTVPCDIYIGDFASTDNSRAEIERAIAEAPRGADHKVEYFRKDEPTEASMLAVNRAIEWMVDQAPNEWLFQASSDDYSLPDRVKTCMQAVAQHDCAGVATTFLFENPSVKLNPGEVMQSGYPTQDGYIGGGDGLFKMAFGSTIWGYRRDFLKKVGLDVPCTLDVYLGYLACLDKGYYVVATPHHVHYMASDNENIGFQGKMRAAEAAGDISQIDRINELNRFQLFELYYLTAKRADELYPLAHQTDKNALLNMIIQQACGWYQERAKLHKARTIPGII